MRTLFKIILAICISMVAVPVNSASANGNIPVYINGDELSFEDAAPIMENNSVLIPMRAIFEALGADVQWIEETRTVIAALDRTQIELTLGRWVAKVNGNDIGLPIPYRPQLNIKAPMFLYVLSVNR